ncbi:MAG: ATP synthase subunit delta [Candidatus Moranbacteria bacterium GW2011_GWA2_39_41]|nr:MAG: ATP synthase subunit delta [Candidatus Moranbacteria bacterium GW2011_GWA2_39_41]
MRLSVNQYAKALYEAAKDKSQSEIDLVVTNFLKLLQKNGQIKLAKKVSEKFSAIWNKEQGVVEAEVVTRYKLQDTMTKEIEKFIKYKYSANEVVIKNVVDEKIQGGVIIRIGDELLDTSVARKLAELKSSLMA